jgi:leader peptidase (prepilin peptidase) / N-methyltransferase
MQAVWRRHLAAPADAAQAASRPRVHLRAKSGPPHDLGYDRCVAMVVSDLPGWLLGVIAFAFGACWGSFFNVAIYRWPQGLSVVRPASHCTYCRARIPAWLNVPIFGYFILRGKTACCGQPLSPRYPIVEALTAVLCLAIAQRFVIAVDPSTPLLRASLIALCYFAFAGGLLVATFVDLEHMEIPDEVSLPGAALGLLTAIYRDPPGVESAAIGAGGGFLLIQVLFVWIYEALLGRRGMGEGDSKLLMMIGAFIGWQGAAFALFAGAAQGLAVAVFGLLTGRKLMPELASGDGGSASTPPDTAPEVDADAAARPEDEDEDGAAYGDSDPPPHWVGHLKLPFGPFLALGALEYLFFGDMLVPAWLELAAHIVPQF